MNNSKYKFQIIFSEISSNLPDSDVQGIQELIDANELGVAFENLCVQLYEYDVTCSPSQLLELVSIGTAMGINPNYWNQIDVSPKQ